MNDIAKSCKMSVPDLYKVFYDKEQIAISVMTYAQDYFEKEIFIYAYDKELNHVERLIRLNYAVEKYFSVGNSGCIFVNFTIETIGHVPAFIVPIRKYFDSFSNAYRTILLGSYDENSAQSLADDFVSDLQGALIMTRVTGTISPLRRLSLRLLQSLNSNGEPFDLASTN